LLVKYSVLSNNLEIKFLLSDMTPLKTIRNTRSLSIHLVAAAVSTTAGNLSRIENGKQKASPELAERLAKYFGYAVTEIQILYPERFKAAV
jgi:transcriptional regulator with XRE-family HTH domain